MPQQTKVDGGVMVHEPGESERERESNEKKRQQFKNVVQNPVITMNETTVACRD